MDIFVTGGTGFVGRWTIAKLSQQGHVVRVLVRGAKQRETAFFDWLTKHNGNADQVQLLEGDLSKPLLGLSPADRQALESTQVVYHMGAAFSWGLSATQAQAITVQGTAELIDLVANMPNLQQMVHLSGYMLAVRQIWESLGLDAEEQDATQPLTQQQVRHLYKHFGSYEASKIESHFLMQRLCVENSIPLTGILLSSVIGHSKTGEIDQPHGIPMLVNTIKKRGMPVIPGKRTDWVPLVTVDYLVDFITGVITLPETIGENYVVLDQDTPSFAELVQMVAKRSGVRAPRLFIPKKIVQVILNMGLDKVLGSNAESLDFLQSFDCDTESTELMAEKLGIVKPDIREALDNFVDYLAA